LAVGEGEGGGWLRRVSGPEEEPAEGRSDRRPTRSARDSQPVGGSGQRHPCPGGQPWARQKRVSGHAGNVRSGQGGAGVLVGGRKRPESRARRPKVSYDDTP